MGLDIETERTLLIPTRSPCIALNCAQLSIRLKDLLGPVTRVKKKKKKKVSVHGVELCRRTYMYRGTSLIRNRAPPRTLQYDYVQGPMVVLGGGAVSYERGNPEERGHARSIGLPRP